MEAPVGRLGFNGRTNNLDVVSIRQYDSAVSCTRVVVEGGAHGGAYNIPPLGHSSARPVNQHQ